MSISLVLGMLLQVAPGATPAPVADPWAPIRFMVGEWTGVAEGQAGQGTVTRSYRFVLGERFLHEQNVSTYPAQPKNRKGEVHEHWSFFSRDRARGAFVLRQFHQEGFVNQYTLAASVVAAPGVLVFESEALENAPAGWRARETYRVLSGDEFEEIFELAPGDGPYEVYSSTRFRRVPRK